MRITPQNFFDHYIIEPFSKDLSSFERKLAFVLSALLALPTLGLLHIRAKYLQSKNIVDLRGERHSALRSLANSINKVSFRVLAPGQEKIKCTNEQVGKVVQERFIKPFYAKPLPSEEQVTVPFHGEWRKWQDLTRSQKIEVNNTGTREHNQLSDSAAEAAVDSWFFAHGQAPFLPNDPRQSHGNDHAARASIFASIFAYLYQKYHPDESLDLQDVMLAQIVAAGHDSGRQTEGPDVYDAKSAENTVEVLKSLGVTDQQVLSDAHDAIEHKDSDPLTGKKPVIARCVQNADSAEFSRLYLTGPVQDGADFEKGKEYLDIYKELKSRGTLKDGRTFEQFSVELTAIRKEMNDIIFHTHSQKFRSKIASEGQNIYEAILQTITPMDYPIIHEILTHIGVKEGQRSREAIAFEHRQKELEAWKNYGIENIPFASLERLAHFETGSDFEHQYKARKETNLRYQTAKSFPELAVAYAHIPEIDRDIADFQKRASAFAANSTMQIDDLPGTHVREAKVALADIMHEELKTLLKNATFSTIDTLKEKTLALLELYKASSELHRSQAIQTTAALALSQISSLYLESGNVQKAKETLQIAATELQIDPANKFYDLKNLLTKEKQGDAILHEERDCGILRKRKLGLQEKKQEGKKMYELSLEIPREVREAVAKQISSLVDENQKEIVEAKFLRKEGDEFVASKSEIVIGEELKITIEPGVEIYIGNTKKWWNHYHFMRIRVAEGTSAQTLHSALAKIGMPMALMPSRKEDIVREVRARSIAFRYPEITYSDPHNPKPVDILYESLNDEQKRTVDFDVQNASLTHVGNGHFEHVVPTIAEEAWKLGVRSVCAFVWGGTTMDDTATVVKSIASNGLLSSQERFQNGILGNGCCPFQNYQTGSADQVFCRMLTKNLFEDGFKLSNFAIAGRVLIMLDTRILERMPYCYKGDRNGVRNPDFYSAYFHAQKQEPIFGFRGKEMIKERLGFEEHVNELYRDGFPLNEAMFDLNIGPNYIQKLVVTTKEDRIALLAALQKAGIYELGGRAIEEVVGVATRLMPELLPTYYDQNPYEELKNGPYYI